MERTMCHNFEGLKQMEVVKIERVVVPMYGNRHTFAYGRATIVGIRGKKITIPFECNRIVNGYVAENQGSYWYPKIVIYKA